MYSSTITSPPYIFASPKYQCYSPHFTSQSSPSTKTPLQKSTKNLSFTLLSSRKLGFYLKRSYVARADSSKNVNVDLNEKKDDFVTRVLKENPSQVEPKYLIGNKLYTLKEKETLSYKSTNSGDELFGLFKKLWKKKVEEALSRDESSVGIDDVYLKDILREYRGKLYVPEQVFGQNVSEEDEFNQNVGDLPRMNLEDFLKAMRSDKIKLLSFVENNGASWFRDFVVELKEIPGDKTLQKTKW